MRAASLPAPRAGLARAGLARAARLRTRIAASPADKLLASLRSMVGGAASAAPPPRPAAAFRDTAPSWNDLAAAVAAAGWADPPPDGGPPTVASLRRTFGTSGEPRLKLYRDSESWEGGGRRRGAGDDRPRRPPCFVLPSRGAYWCGYCQKVQLQLEEKRVPYVLEKINMRCYGSKVSGRGREGGRGARALGPSPHPLPRSPRPSPTSFRPACSPSSKWTGGWSRSRPSSWI